MAQILELTAEAREGVGKGAARAVRRKGMIPAVIYGDKKPPIPISLPIKEVTTRLHAGGFLTHLMQIQVGAESIRVIPKDYQLDPVRDFLMHVDFLRVGEGGRLTLEIPVHFRNEAIAPGIKRGGALNIVRHTIELSVPADAIPESIDVDLAGLDIGDSLHISAITLPAGAVPTITDRDFTIATIAGTGGGAEAGEGGTEAG